MYDSASAGYNYISGPLDKQAIPMKNASKTTHRKVPNTELEDNRERIMSGTLQWVKEVFLDPDDSDLKIVFRRDEKTLELPGHSFVLMRSGSQVLRKMIETKDFKEGTTKTIELKGVDLQVGVYFLQFMYLEAIPDCSDTELVHLIKAGSMYDLPNLASQCDSKLCSMIGIRNCVNIHESLFQLEEPRLTKTLCLKTMAENGNNFFLGNSHLGLGSETFSSLISSELLSIPKEEIVIEALWDWGKRQCSYNFQSRTAQNITEFVVPISEHILWEKVSADSYTFSAPELLDFVVKMKSKYESNPVNSKRRESQLPLKQNFQFSFGASNN